MGKQLIGLTEWTRKVAAGEIDLTKDKALAYFSFGLSSNKLHKYEASVQQFQKAIELRSDYAEAYLELGNAHKGLSEYDAALKCYQQAVELEPEFIEALFNIASIKFAVGNLESAKKYYQKASDLGCDDSKLCLRVTEQLMASGYEGHKSRLYQNWDTCPEYAKWMVRGYEFRHFSKPAWDGSPLGNSRLLVYAEEGLGDAIQMVRYLRWIKENRGGYLILECSSKLIDLFRTCSWIDELIETDPCYQEPNIDYDYRIGLMKLPLLFLTEEETIPTYEQYLEADPQLEAYWQRKLRPYKGLKIGIRWAGNPTFKNYTIRSCSLKDFVSIANLPDANLFSLQRDADVDQLKECDFQVVDFSDKFYTFAQTAGMMTNLDIIVTSDTSVAHVAGALGKVVYIALSTQPDRRWGYIEKTSAWYPSMNLYRQVEEGNWHSVFAAIAEDIAKKFNTSITSKSERHLAACAV